MQNIRLRFAPSPTGPLHIGGVRTALYNYLLARKLNGTFILRIEDTDQNRYVPGAEDYIVEALKWCGIEPDEGPGYGGDYGPYRQSERKDLYGKYALQLVENGHAYYAFDTPEELDLRRQAEKEAGNHSFKYDSKLRMEMRNSLTLSEAETKALLESGKPYTIRLKVPSGETVTIHDEVRGEVNFQTDELDDKVILKSDGMPTYHLANIVDDHLMEISHVIRGEEWLPSTAHHVLLYRFLDWESEMPAFAHLPLILKPNGKGKLSKRDGAKLGIPVFPLSWNGENEEDSFIGFREFGFDPAAVNNFLAFLGWNPGTEQEIFSLEGLCEAFSVEQVGKSGARFDFDKARWFNEQYLQASSDEALAVVIQPLAKERGYVVSDEFMAAVCGMLKERVTFYPDILEDGYYFFEGVIEYDAKVIRKKWKPERKPQFENLQSGLKGLGDYSAEAIKSAVTGFMEENDFGFGDVLPVLRVALSGTTKGPDVFKMMELLGQEEVDERLAVAYRHFEEQQAS
ncbi:MAG: glutamate--tRNA ligase [Bacteroidetes bacterium]|nr:glutamate--tRNA ligase [Bacteroidota bacterium]